MLPPKQQPARSPGDAPSTLPAAARARGLLKGQMLDAALGCSVLLVLPLCSFTESSEARADMS